MKRLFLTILFIFTFSLMNGQINELGVFAGGSNFMGDVGATTYIKPNEFAFGAIYKWNRSARYAWRFSYTHAKLTGADDQSDQPARVTRDYDFENTVDEFSAGLEFNFFNFNLHDLKNRATPYVFTGINYFRYDSQYIPTKTTVVDERSGSWAIPMVLGFKSRIAYNLIIGAEVGVRYTFTDDIDGSNPRNENYQNYKFGNLNSNDWYTFSGVTLTYTFGENPCYCAQ